MGGVTQSGVVNSATDNVFLSSIIGGSLNTITNGTSSTIFGSLGSTVTGSCYSSIIGGTSNSICEACFAVILGGTCNYNNNGNHSIISGDCNCVNGALNSSIIGGLENKLCTNANRSAIISSDCSCMIYMQGATNNIILGSCLVKFDGECIYSSSIISGKNDSIEWCTKHSSIISGSDNLLHYSNYSSIISSTGSEICQGTMSVIIGSKAFIKNSCSSIILGAIGGDLYTALPMGYYGATAGESRIVNGANNTIIGGGSYQTSGYLSCSYPNIICNSYASSVIGGRGNLICSKTGKDNYFTTQLSYSGVLLGEKNKILSGTVSSTTNHVVRNSTILGGLCNLIHSSNSDETSQSANVSFGSSIVGGRGNSIRNSSSSFISSSGYSCITATGSTNDLEFNSVISTRQGCILGVVCSNSIVASLFSGILSCNGYRIEQSLISSSKCVYICSSSSTKQSISNSVIGSYCSSLKDSRSSSLINSLRGTVSNSEDSLLASTRGSYICNSCISGIITSTVSSICNSIISTIISSSASCIKDSCNSLILGGRGLTLSNERDTVYVSTLKINSVTQSIDTNRVLVWDCDSCVRYSTINAAGVIDICEIAWGTGVGITSSDHFRFDCQRCNLLMGCNQGPTFTHASSSYWSVNLGKGCNCITNSNSAVILGGCKQLVATSSYSSIIGGQSNTIWCSNYSSTIGGKFLTITQSNYSTIINGSSSQIESVFSTIISGICQCIDTNSNYSSIVSGKCGCITTSDYSTIIGGFAGNSKNTIRNSNSSLVLNSTCYSLIGTSSCSMIANALCSKIEESKGSLILAGGCNRIVDQSYRSLIFGYRNEIDNSKDSIVLGNRNNCICINSQSSTIISGCENVIINNACDSIIIQGFDNCVANSGFKNSIFGSDLSVINTSCHSTIISSYKSCTFNTKWSGVIASSQSYICGEKSLSSCQIKSSIIVGGVQHLICNSSYSSIIGGYKNCLCESRSGSIISSINSRVLTKGGQSFLSGIITSCCGEMINSKSSTIISSWESTETCSYQSVIIASTHSGSFRNKASALLSSVDSNVNSSLSSTIVSSECSLICSATNSAIIGSSASYICISQNSAIIGGRGLTLSNENQVVYLPELKINKVDQCLTLTKFLAWDDTNKYVRWGTPGLDNGITGSTIFYTGSFWTYSSTNIYNNGIYVGIGLTNSNTNIYATPSSNLHVFGSLSLDVKTASSDYILTDRNFTLLASPPSAGMTVSLPSASLAKHRVYVIKKVNLGGFVYVARNGSDTFEGFGGSITLENQWDYYMLQSDGVNMWIKLGGAVGLNLL
jgi:hypothetical protein